MSAASGSLRTSLAHPLACLPTICTALPLYEYHCGVCTGCAWSRVAALSAAKRPLVNALLSLGLGFDGGMVMAPLESVPMPESEPRVA